MTLQDFINDGWEPFFGDVIIADVKMQRILPTGERQHLLFQISPDKKGVEPLFIPRDLELPEKSLAQFQVSEFIKGSAKMANIDCLEAFTPEAINQILQMLKKSEQ